MSDTKGKEVPMTGADVKQHKRMASTQSGSFHLQP